MKNSQKRLIKNTWVYTNPGHEKRIPCMLLQKINEKHAWFEFPKGFIQWLEE